MGVSVLEMGLGASANLKLQNPDSLTPELEGNRQMGQHKVCCVQNPHSLNF